MFEATVRDGVCQCLAENSRWLGTGQSGGYREADAVYNVTVPEGFDRTDLATYVEERRRRAGFEVDGPGLLTGVDVAHARCASAGPVTALATVGLSNPAALPLQERSHEGRKTDDADTSDAGWRPGTVNLVVGADRGLDDGALAELLATCVEAKTATLTQLTGFPGTTSDAAFVGTGDGDPAEFAGSATTVGSAARACVRDAIRASFAARYDEADPPVSVADARHGVVTDRQADVFAPRTGNHD
jgi:adenosylcobinamide hydrolase